MDMVIGKIHLDCTVLTEFDLLFSIAMLLCVVFY